MAAKYHVELIIGTGELPPLLDYLAKLGNVFRVEIKPVTEQRLDGEPPRARRKYNKKSKRWNYAPGGVRGIVLEELKKHGGSVRYSDLSRVVVKHGYTKNSLGSPLDRMVKLGEVKRAEPGHYVLGKEHKE